jgi:hypothetical protein
MRASRVVFSGKKWKSECAKDPAPGAPSHQVSTAIFVIFDLSRPYDGLFAMSSAPMRTALDSMLRP